MDRKCNEMINMDKLVKMMNMEELEQVDKLLLKKVIEPELEQREMPEEIYHYTSPVGLKGILENHSLWFTHYRFLNDKSEKKYTYKLLEECLLMYKEKLDDGFFAQIMRGLHHNIIHHSKVDWFNDIYQVPEYYIASFACNGDSLSLWNYYTKNANKTGYNIRFTLKELTQSLQKGNYDVRKIIYDRREQEDKIARLLLGFSEAWDEQRGMVFLAILVALFWEMIDEASLAFKSPAFQDECEIRIVYKANEKHKVAERFREMNGIFVPYFDDEFEKKSVKGITISPTQQDELAVEGIGRLLEHYGYDNVEKQEVKVSEVPLRY